MKHPCGRCKKKVTQTFCWPVGVWWDRPVCRHCAFVLRSSRDRQIEREMEDLPVPDVSDEAWSEALRLVVEQRKELMGKDAGDGPDQAAPR